MNGSSWPNERESFNSRQFSSSHYSRSRLARALHLNCTALSQSQFFMYTISRDIPISRLIFRYESGTCIMGMFRCLGSP